MMEDDNEDMDLDFNPFDSTFENFEDFNSQDVESLAQELQFYEQKAEVLAGQGALQNFSFSRDEFTFNQAFFSEDPLEGLALPEGESQPPAAFDSGFSGLDRRKTKAPSKTHEESPPPQRSRSVGSLKQPEAQAHSGGSLHSDGFSKFSFGQELPAVESHKFGQQQSPQSGKKVGSEMQQLGGLQDSLLASLLETREESEAHQDTPLFNFETDSKPFEFGASVFANGTTSHHDSPRGEEEPSTRNGSGNLLEPGLLPTDETNESSKAHMWMSSDGDDIPLVALKAASKGTKKAPPPAKETKRSRKRASSSPLTKKLDPAEAARLEKNRIKAQRHRDKMKAWKEDVKVENEDLRRQRQLLAEEREALAVDKASLEREKAETERTLANLQAELSRLQSENAQLWNQNQDLSEAAQVGPRQVDVDHSKEASSEEIPRVLELENMNERLTDQNSKLEEELAVVKGALASQLHTMSSLVAIRPLKHEGDF